MGSPQSDAENRPTAIRDMRWSPSEEAVARQAFDRALHRELESVIREAQRLAAEIQQPSDLWELEDYLREAAQGHRLPVRLPVFRAPVRLCSPDQHRPPQCGRTERAQRGKARDYSRSCIALTRCCLRLQRIIR